MRKLLPVAIAFAAALSAAQPAGQARPTPRAGNYLYRVSLVQAAPGKLTELIELYKSKFAASASVGDPAPLWVRHSQGDRWDLMILQPMGSYAEFYAPDRTTRRMRTEQALAGKIRDDITWHEDLYCTGPAIADLRNAFAGGFFHVEMFIA
ncbi:MAG TPA: hypothetical protein VE998_09850, partial [Terriglobales bacterium]|nr:hypothetical protein [Terriglobales bacterium]